MRTDPSDMEFQLNSLFPHWPGVVFRQRPDMSLERAEGQIEELTGCSAARWGSEPGLFWRLIHELDEEPFRLELGRLRWGGEGVRQRFRFRHPVSGRVRYLSEFRRAEADSRGGLSGYEGFWLDVSRETLAERRLAGAAWKEVLGLLTLGLAHDFNNLLAGIQGLSSTLLTQIAADHPLKDGLVLVKRNTQAAAQVIERIGQLHLAQTGTRSYHGLNEVVKESVELLCKVVPRRIEIVRQLASETLAMYVDAVELKQVLIGLALNAADAMPEGGTLTIRTEERLSLPELSHRVGILPRLPAVCLSVIDTGSGIRPRLLPFLFDPFFTTKPMNRGSGLGLYTARLFAEKHEGALSVESEDGAGATFRVWLPRADFTEADRALQWSRQQRCRLLLAGPPGRVLELTAELLRRHHYHVVAAGVDAEDLLRSEDYAFDGVLLEVEPSDPRPLALVQFIRRHKLPLKIILKAVGTPADDLPTGLLGTADLVIPPGLSEAAMVQRLAEVFDRPAPGRSPISP